MITATGIEDIYLLSPMQEGMLFHTLYEPESNIYFRRLSCSIAGELNRAAFESAWRLAFERHPILRASFHWEDLDHPLQVVHQKVPLPLEYYDWRELPPNAQQESLETLLAADCAQGFEIEKSPLTRLYLIQIGAQCHQFVWSYHHLILDGWSKSLLLKEVFSLYDALCHGRAIGLKPSTPYR